MRYKMIGIVALAALAAAGVRAEDSAKSSKYPVQFVTAEKDVNLEVVDWGGSGRPLVFLAALGADALEEGFVAARPAGFAMEPGICPVSGRQHRLRERRIFFYARRFAGR